MDLFEASNSAFEPSLQVVKEIPSKLSLSHIVEESCESLRVPPPTDPSDRKDISVQSNVPEVTADYADVDATSNDESHSKTVFSEMPSTATDRVATTSIVSSVAPTEDRSRLHNDDDDDYSRRIEDNLDLLSPGFVGRGSLPYIPKYSPMASLWANHSCPDLGRQKSHDFCIEIQIDGEPHVIACSVKDDPIDVAREFIVQNNINPQQLDALTEFIAEHFRLAEQAEKEENKCLTEAAENVDSSLSQKSPVLMELTVGEETISMVDERAESGISYDSPHSEPMNISAKSSEHSDTSLVAKDESARTSLRTSVRPATTSLLFKVAVEDKNASLSSAESSPDTMSIEPGTSRSSFSETNLSVSVKTSPDAMSVEQGTSRSSFAESTLFASVKTSPDQDVDNVTSFLDANSPPSSSDKETDNEEVESDLSPDLRGNSSRNKISSDEEAIPSSQEASCSIVESAPEIAKPSLQGSATKKIFGLDRRVTISLDRQGPIEKSRKGSRFSLMAPKSRLSHLEMNDSENRRMSRFLRNGKTFLDTSPAKQSPPPMPPAMKLVDEVEKIETEKAVESQAKMMDGKCTDVLEMLLSGN